MKILYWNTLPAVLCLNNVGGNSSGIRSKTLSGLLLPLLLPLNILIANLAFAVPILHPCKTSIEQFIAERGIDLSEPLLRIADPLTQNRELFTSKRFGEIYELPSDSTSTFTLRQFTSKASQLFTWKEREKCQLSTRRGKPSPYQKLVRNIQFSSIPLLNDQDIATIISTQKRGLIYTWSPKMPISIAGLEIIERVAHSHQLPITFLLDPTLSLKNLKTAARQFKHKPQYLNRTNSLELLERGLLLHFPSLFLFDDGKISTAPILGQRGQKGFELIVSSFFKPPSLKMGDKKQPPPTNLIKTMAQPIPVKFRKVTTLPGEFGYFDKPVWGTRWIGLHLDWSTGYYFNLDTEQLLPLGYPNDTYVTPHDHLYSFIWAKPGPVGGGELGIVENEEFLKMASDPHFQANPLFVDASINADYQSVGSLNLGTEKSTYRVITGGYENKLSYRDYEITHRQGSQAPQVRPTGPAGIICKKTLGDISFGTPMLSKDGLEIALTTQGVSKIFRLDPIDPELCNEQISFPLETSKVAFSFDGHSIAFAYGGQPYLLRRKSGRLYRLEGFNETVGYGMAVFPEFREDGSLVMPYTLSEEDKMVIIEFEVDETYQ